MLIYAVNGNTCKEGIDVKDLQCKGSEADVNCWIECKKRHGPSANAQCEADGFPQFYSCYCLWEC